LASGRAFRHWYGDSRGHGMEIPESTDYLAWTLASHDVV
jgi:hypothetical protein